MSKIKSALISVFDKNGLLPLLKLLSENNVTIYSTGGTYNYIIEQGFKCIAVEDITGYPSIFGGRVKTLHPGVMGGILFRRDVEEDLAQADKYKIPQIDLVIVDLYPFEKTVASNASHEDIIEKIDIGGISLIRAAAKNYNDVTIISSKAQYDEILTILSCQNCETTLEQRYKFALAAFGESSRYDSAIFSYFNRDINCGVRICFDGSKHLRYGENPHQKGIFFGNFEEMFEQLHGKEISYNNLLDIDAAVGLIKEFERPTFAILKHNNACGVASKDDIFSAWETALACDPVSAFGGVLIANREIDEKTAEKINEIFFEVIIAPNYETKALEILKQKKNRIILKSKELIINNKRYRSILNGVLEQDYDSYCDSDDNFNFITKNRPNDNQIKDLLFAHKIVKHLKSNAITLVKNEQLLGSGMGQTSRVDALKQAIEKANSFNLDLKDSVMASDAFFPFSDCVDIAYKAGVRAVIQPGGSIRDKDSIEFCDNHNIPMIITGIRHFRH